MPVKYEKELSDLRQRAEALAESIAQEKEYERPGFQSYVRSMPPTNEEVAHRIKLQKIVGALGQLVADVDEYLAD